MTENIQEFDDVNSSDESTSYSSSDVNVGSVAPETPKERLYTREELERTVKSAKIQTKQSLLRKMGEDPEQGYQNQTQGGFDESKVRQLAKEEADRLYQEQLNKHQRALEEAQNRQFGEQFATKLLASKAEHPEVEKAFMELNAIQNPVLMNGLNSLDKEVMGDVVMNLRSREEEYSRLLLLSQAAPILAQEKLRSLAESIRANKQAKATADATKVPEPLKSIDPSLASFDNGSRTLEERKRRFKF